MDVPHNNTILVLIAGGHASGKRSGANILKQQLRELDQDLKVKEIDMNEFFQYDSLRPGCKEPKLCDFTMIKENLKLCMNESYDVVILFGLYALYDQEIVNQATVKIFIDCDSDVRLGRWIERDILNKPDSNLDETALQYHQQNQLETLLNNYLQCSREEMKLYINDTKECADIILPRGADLVGFTLILDGLKPLLFDRIVQHKLMNELAKKESTINSTTSHNSADRETVLHTLKQISDMPSVQSLTNDNFFNSKKIYYEAN